VNKIVVLPVLVPLLGAAIGLLVRRWPAWQRAVTFAALLAALASSIALLVEVERTDLPVVAWLGGWEPRIGISYVADRLSVLMLLATTVTMVVIAAFSTGERPDDRRPAVYQPLILLLTAGICAAFLAGDLFHLFVAFEVLLLASYALLTLDSDRPQIRSGTTYVVLNTVESMVLLTAIGLVYAACGTLNLADLPTRLSELDPGLRTGLHLLLLVAFGMKAAVFPLCFWLPDAYPTAPSPVTAVFAGLLTKVGVYALIRTQTLLFPGELRPLLGVVAVATMLIGVLGAIAQNDIKRILSFHIVSQIGYMVAGLAIGGVAAIAATVFFLLHQIPTKTSLFLVDGVIQRDHGTSRLDRLSGLSHRSGLLAVLFLIPALSLAGLPPFSGFIAKLGIVTAGIGSGDYLLTAALVAGSLLTLVSMTKIWTNAFWGPRLADEAAGRPAGTGGMAMRAATAGLVTIVVAIALAAGPLYRYCERLAEDITHPAPTSQELADP